MNALMSALGKAKVGAPKEEPAEAEPEEDDAVLDGYAEAAFDALKNDDKAAFVEAFKGAVRCCTAE